MSDEFSTTIPKKLAITFSHTPLEKIAVMQLPGFCAWQLDHAPWDYEVDVWTGHCGGRWHFSKGETPKKNGMNYCPNCGRVLVQVDAEEEE
jgi:hypothetical protein